MFCIGTATLPAPRMLPRMAATCEHVDEVRTDWAPAEDAVCEECEREGRTDWVSPVSYTHLTLPTNREV